MGKDNQPKPHGYESWEAVANKIDHEGGLMEFLEYGGAKFAMEDGELWMELEYLIELHNRCYDKIMEHVEDE